MWKVEGWVEKRLSTANLRFIEIRNTNAAAKVGVLELVAATKPDIVLTMEVEQPATMSGRGAGRIGTRTIGWY